MTNNQDLLDADMGTPPPSTVDVNAIMVRQRHRARFRQVALSGGVGAMTLAIAVVLVVLRGAGGGTPVPPANPTTTTPAHVATPREQEAARLTQVLQQLLTAALPGAEYLPLPEDASLAHPLTDPLVFVDEGTYFLAGAIIRDAQGMSTFSVSVGKEDTQFRNERECFSDPAPLDMRVHCEVRPGADGSKTEVINNSSKYTDLMVLAAEIIRPNDNAVKVSITNRTGSTDSDEVFRPKPHLTLQQVITLAQDPDLATTLP